MMKHFTPVLASLLVVAGLATTAAGVRFTAMNNASTTPGGQRFDEEYGVGYAVQVMSEASFFTWKIFNQTAPEDRRAAMDDRVKLVVNFINTNILAFERDSESSITLNAGYVNNITGDVRTLVTGLLYHEVTHVWQWGQQDTNQTHSWIYEGMADFVRLRAGYAATYWLQPGQGDSWDTGYDVTAWFLDYCDQLRPGFMAVLNQRLKDGYSDDDFLQIMGKSVQELWRDYKAKYGG
ncbi:uncharacterized protein LOC119356915 [Triticum dicoccoides]|uniref:uncharacterized protein LOC119356915 n=1 Tax=Triticum dicoccoides TaxID=85692 RepID=UPI00188F80F3|nr:uncharacterized protein LOC119356915 [Triticum dicoccoides]